MIWFKTVVLTYYIISVSYVYVYYLYVLMSIRMFSEKSSSRLDMKELADLTSSKQLQLDAIEDYWRAIHVFRYTENDITLNIAISVSS